MAARAHQNQPEYQPDPTGPRFVHLRVHSAYSLLEGALPIYDLVKLAVADAMPAVALTDTNNLFGALEFSEVASQAGVQPIIGCALMVDFQGLFDAGKAVAFTRPDRKPLRGVVPLLAQSVEGYANLMALTSAAFLDKDEADDAVVPFRRLCQHASGLIALTGGPDGLIHHALADGQEERARTVLSAMAKAFPDRLYGEVQRHGLRAERAVEPLFLDMVDAARLPVVATNQAYFPKTTDFEAHDALICIAGGRYMAEDERRRLTPDHAFKTRADMGRVFADMPEALAASVEIAERCAFRPKPRKPILPQFVEAGAAAGSDIAEAEAAELARQAHKGLDARLANHGRAPGFDEVAYRERLDYELSVIARMKFPGYFLIVADFIQWAKGQGIPVGPGRGSGAGSLVAYALTITDLDPLRFGLLFERFLNPERVSMPDFDIDFCQDRRDEVIAYVRDKYGADRVAQIITFGKLQARAVLRDVGRVLQMPYGQVDRLCKLVPNNPANPVTLPEAIAGEPRLQEARDQEPIVAKLLDIGQRLEGLYRHASTHAAGVVIGDRPLTELVPLYRDPRAPLPATQFNMKWVEAAGLVKFDFLGLKTLTVIEKTCALLAKRGVVVEPDRLPLDDGPTYALLARAETVGVFQLESTGMREALRKLKPDRIEDIIAMVALYRPGPMDNIPSYINCKAGREQPNYLHPKLEPVLRETYGVIIYQEQVMQIAQILSGYSLGEADLLRRAMGKKIKAEMDKQKERFVEGAVANGVDRATADNIFELVAKFAGYGFNKSHAAAYAIVAYQTAYLRANYPVEFLAASMTLDIQNTDKLAVFGQEARRIGITIAPPCVNRSDVEFAPEGHAIRYALAALKNMGRPAAEHVVGLREQKPFASLADFASRISPRAVNKRAIETLAGAGAFDALARDRAAVFAGADRIIAHAGLIQDDRAAGQFGLFGDSGAAPEQTLALPQVAPWSLGEKLDQEFQAVGLFLSGHPLDPFADVIARLQGVETWAQFSARADGPSTAGRVAALVGDIRERRNKMGNRYAFATFSDQTGTFEGIVFADTLAACGEHLVVGQPVLVRLEAERDGETLKIKIHGVENLEARANADRRELLITLDETARIPEIVKVLQAEGPGRLKVRLRVPDAGAMAEVHLPGGFAIPHQHLERLRALRGVVAVRDR